MKESSASNVPLLGRSGTQMAASLTCRQQPEKLQDVLATSPEVVNTKSRHRKAGSHR